MIANIQTIPAWATYPSDQNREKSDILLFRQRKTELRAIWFARETFGFPALSAKTRIPLQRAGPCFNSNLVHKKEPAETSSLFSRNIPFEPGRLNRLFRQVRLEALGKTILTQFPENLFKNRIPKSRHYDRSTYFADGPLMARMGTSPSERKHPPGMRKTAFIK